MNEILRSKDVPSHYAKGITLPFHNKRYKTDCTNYRGITLLSIHEKY